MSEMENLINNISARAVCLTSGAPAAATALSPALVKQLISKVWQRRRCSNQRHRLLQPFLRLIWTSTPPTLCTACSADATGVKMANLH